MRALARLILAVVAAGLAAGLVGASALVLVLSRLPPYQPESWISGLFVFGVILSLYGLVAATLIGIPAHLILSRMKWTGWQPYLAVGVVSGTLVALAFGGAVAMVTGGVAAGAAGASVFWLIVRPDRHRPGEA